MLLDIQIKKCTKCDTDKPLEMFYKKKDGKFGVRADCKECHDKQKKQYNEAHKEEIKQYREENKEEKREYDKQYRKDNKEEIKQYYEENKEKKKQYYEDNKEEILDQQKQYARKRLVEDPNFKLAKYLRTRLHAALKGNYKSGSAVLDLGGTIEELWQWLEKQFKAAWTKENYGTIWEVDDIIPLSTVNLEDRQELLRVCHYTNLRPLSCFENITRGNKVTQEENDYVLNLQRKGKIK